MRSATEPKVADIAPTESDRPTHGGSECSRMHLRSSDTEAGSTERDPVVSFWVLETSARFLRIDYDASPLVGSREGLDYVRGYFDADGGMPTSSTARLYLQFSQKNRASLEKVVAVLESWDITCGRVHNPSRHVDPDYWRVYVRSASHERFLKLVGSWHPRKRQQIATRMVR